MRARLVFMALATALAATVAVSGWASETARQLEISNSGIEFLRDVEGFRANLYNDAGGRCTIGYGHLVHLGKCDGTEPEELRNGITEDRAAELLRQDVGGAVDAVNRLVKGSLNQNQFDALVSFVHDVGVPQFAGSTLLKVLNARKLGQAPAQMGRWVRSGGRRVTGLVNRRNDEVKLFQKNPSDAGGGTEGGCVEFTVEFGQGREVVDGVAALLPQTLTGCFPRTVTLTVVNESPQFLLIRGTGDGAQKPINCGGVGTYFGDVGEQVCKLTFTTFDPPRVDPRQDLAYAFEVPHTTLSALYPSGDPSFPEDGRPVWTRDPADPSPCAGNDSAGYCDVYLGSRGSTDPPEQLAQPRSITVRVRLEAGTATRRALEPRR